MHRYCQGEDIRDRLPMGMNLASQKMGMHEWSYSNYYDGAERRIMPHVDLKEAIQEARYRSGARLHGGAGCKAKSSAA